MLRIRYDTDPDFDAILHFIGALDEELSEIDKLLSDEKLLELIEADLSQRYPQTTQTGRNSTPSRGDCPDVSPKALTVNQLRKNDKNGEREYDLATVLPSLLQPTSYEKYAAAMVKFD